MTQPHSTYSGVSIALHWLTALLVVGQVLTVMAMDTDLADNRPLWSMLHKSGGLTILVLTLARIGWRLREPWIPEPVATPRWQAFAARAVHVGFYGVLLAMPLIGWAASSAAGRDILWYGLFQWPLLPIEGGRDAARDIIEWHELSAKLLYVLLALHVGAALKHHLIDRDNVLRRMLPVLPDRGFVDPRGPHGAP